MKFLMPGSQRVRHGLRRRTTQRAVHHKLNTGPIHFLRGAQRKRRETGLAEPGFPQSAS